MSCQFPILNSRRHSVALFSSFSDFALCRGNSTLSFGLQTAISFHSRTVGFSGLQREEITRLDWSDRLLTAQQESVGR
jgi:hypothetical protein